MRCFSPLYIYPSKAATEKIPIDCGKCPYCKKRRVNGWVFRLLEEDKISSSSYFVTLTYDTRYVPITSNGYMGLKKKDFQNFVKRLRKKQYKDGHDSKIKYYACGEYGTINRRPHYHAIMFNVEDKEYIKHAWEVINNKGERELQGKIDIGTVSGASIAYTAKYIDKDKTIPEHQYDDRLPEFSLMSKGLGENYITDAAKKWHQSDLSRMYVTHPGGVKVAMPKYYRERIFTDAQREIQRHNLVRLEKVELQEQFREFEKKYKNSDITFETWLETIKYGQSARFNKNLNKRNL